MKKEEKKPTIINKQKISTTTNFSKFESTTEITGRLKNALQHPICRIQWIVQLDDSVIILW